MSKNILINTFDGQRDDETVETIVRKNSLFLWKFFLVMILFLALFFVSLSLNFVNLYVCAGVLFILFCIVVHCLIVWYFSIYIITDQRVRTINQKNFFIKEVYDIELSKIQHIGYKIPNIMGYILNYGTIIAQTDSGDLIMHYIPEPDKIYNLLQNLTKGN
jgi:Ca2+/Na+ antiporter